MVWLGNSVRFPPLRFGGEGPRILRVSEDVLRVSEDFSFGQQMQKSGFVSVPSADSETLEQPRSKIFARGEQQSSKACMIELGWCKQESWKEISSRFSLAKTWFCM